MDIFSLLRKMTEYQASDLYLTVGLPPSWRNVEFITETKTPLTQEEILKMMNQIITPEDHRKFMAEKELNLPLMDEQNTRYRVNLFYQQQNIGMVIRRVNDQIPNIDELCLNSAYKDAIMETRGLILVTGMSGAGKSTSIAAMLDHRNNHGNGHVITIEDPIEYVHKHKNCIFTQREIGFDTQSWEKALKSALRQRPDIIFIGEIRDAETMAQAIHFAETGHLCIASLHATSAAQAIERVANLQPSSLKESNLYSLAHVLKYIFAQRLVKSKSGNRNIPAIEILKNVGHIKPLIMQGKVGEIRDLLGRNSDIGMMNFENSLLELLHKGQITEETAIAEADNPDNMRLNIMKVRVKPSRPPKYEVTGF